MDDGKLMTHSTRRNVLAATAALVSTPVSALADAAAAPSTPPSPPAALPPAPMSSRKFAEQMMFSAVRLTFPRSSGSGFLFGFFNTGTSMVLGVVSNRHVFQVDAQCHALQGDQCELQESGSFTLTLAKPDGTPDIGNVHVIEMTDIPHRLVVHPFADLAVYFISDVVNEMTASKLLPYIVALNQNFIPDEQRWQTFSPLEDIVTSGYPGAFWDSKNVLPLFHSGHTATPVYVDFQGREEFLLDTTTWPGASGSPVFIYNSGVINEDNSITFGQRLYLAGIVYGVPTQEIDGSVVIAHAPTNPGQQPTYEATPLISASNIPTNLGVCIRSTRVLEFEPILAKLGFRIPVGYTMRASYPVR